VGIFGTHSAGMEGVALFLGSFPHEEGGDWGRGGDDVARG
jgi:hypothetical protein